MPDRAVWISDVHLGTRECQEGRLLSFLRGVSGCARLYLVGDVVDVWAMRRLWYWPSSHGEVLREVLRVARGGAEVVFIPGNHDAEARLFDGVSVSVGPSGGSVSVRLEAEHRCLDGRRLLVTHGDVYDELLRSTGTGAALAWGAVLLSLAGRGVDRVGGWFGWGRASLVDRVIRAYGGLVDNHRRFRRMALLDARVRGYDGVVCGHIHRAQMRDIDGVLYCNDGDWVESLTALVEHHDGRLELVDWSSAQRAPTEKATLALEASLS